MDPVLLTSNEVPHDDSSGCEQIGDGEVAQKLFVASFEPEIICRYPLGTTNMTNSTLLL